MAHRIHIFGASGSGTTTLGRALADAWGVPLLDTDHYFWLPTEPPFQDVRPLGQRLERLHDDMVRHASWVSSGSLCGWGDPLVTLFDAAVYLFLEPEIRMRRLVCRERDRYGDAALAQGGAMHEQHLAFIKWAQDYDLGGLDMRSKARHEAWIQTLPCPVLRLDSVASVDENLAAVTRWLARDGGEVALQN